MLNTYEVKIVFLFVILASTQVLGFGQEEQGFVLQATEGNLSVWVRTEANKEMTVRVATTAKTSVRPVMLILDDAANYPNWVHRCAEAYILPGGSANEYTYCSRINMPFPFNDREVVAAIKQSVNPVTGIYLRHITSTPDAIPRTKGVKREEVYTSVWEVKPIAAGEVKLTCSVRTSAGAGLPNWLRKEIMRGGPVKTMKALVKHLETK